MNIVSNFQKIFNNINLIRKNITIIAVCKTFNISQIMPLINFGHVHFGENKVQEMCDKQLLLPTDIQWHIVGHLQSNKVKYIAPFVSLIHAVDSLKLLQEINKQAAKNNRIIDCLLQIYIAQEETQRGSLFWPSEAFILWEKRAGCPF